MLAMLPAWIIALLVLPGVLAVKDMQMHLPVARVGQPVRLSCHYDLDGAALYSIKWYRDDNEFYSYVPKEIPPMRIYPHQNISVDLAQSDANSVTLLNVSRSLVGFYKCEVSGDQPLFHTDIKLEYLNVYEPPSRKPELTVEKLPGGAVRANCSTSPSFPGANITWYIDNTKHGHPAPAVHFHSGVPGVTGVTGVTGFGGVPMASASSLASLASWEVDEWSHSVLRLERRSGGGQGPRSLRCEASIYEDAWKQSSDEASLRGPGDHPHLAPVRGAASAASGTRACGYLAALTLLLPSLLSVSAR